MPVTRFTGLSPRVKYGPSVEEKSDDKWRVLLKSSGDHVEPMTAQEAKEGLYSTNRYLAAAVVRDSYSWSVLLQAGDLWQEDEKCCGWGRRRVRHPPEGGQMCSLIHAFRHSLPTHLFIFFYKPSSRIYDVLAQFLMLEMQQSTSRSW